MTTYGGTGTIATLLAMTLMMGCAATPSTEEEHAGHHPEATAPAGATAGNSAPEAMAAMQERMNPNMQKMQEQMAAIHKTTDPKEHARLLDEHMETMKAMMQDMQKGSGGMMMGNGMPMQGKEASGGMGMMPMMQMMMDQLMQHQKAMEVVPK